MKIVLSVLAATVLCGCGHGLSSYEEARTDMLKEATNAVIGIQKIIEIKCTPEYTNTFGGMIWNSVTVDYLNTRGGMERTNVPMLFTAYKGSDGAQHLRCEVDFHYFAAKDKADFQESLRKASEPSSPKAQ